MEAYDTDGDGFIAEAELHAAPALLAAMETLDTDNDEKVSESEIAERIRAWQENGTGITRVRCYVKMNGRLVEGAEITFEPEAFLGDEMRSAVGVTGPDGAVTPIIPKANRPAADSPPGIQFGFFKVKVSKKIGGKESIPDKYNTKTILGQQISPDDPSMLKQRVEVIMKK